MSERKDERRTTEEERKCRKEGVDTKSSVTMTLAVQTSRSGACSCFCTTPRERDLDLEQCLVLNDEWDHRVHCLPSQWICRPSISAPGRNWSVRFLDAWFSIILCSHEASHGMFAAILFLLRDRHCDSKFFAIMARRDILTPKIKLSATIALFVILRRRWRWWEHVMRY